MIEPVILSEINSDLACEVFTHWLNDEPYTLLLIPGKHDMAMKALEKASEQINGGSELYAGVRAIHAPLPGFILTILKQLRPNPDMKPVDWDHIGNYAILSISNFYNNIGEIILNEDAAVNLGGRINMLVRRAMTFDRPLDE